MLFLLGGGRRATACAPHIEDKLVAVSFQTVAELRYGAIRRGYGEDKKRALERLMRNFVVLIADEATSEAWASLKRTAELNGLSKSCGGSLGSGDRETT